MHCLGTCKNGKACHYKAKNKGYCLVHANTITHAIDEFETNLFDHVVDAPLDVRYMTAYVALIDTMKRETDLRKNIVVYLEKKAPFMKNNILELHKELHAISGWEVELMLLGTKNIVSKERAELLDKMYIRMKKLYNWDSL